MTAACSVVTLDDHVCIDPTKVEQQHHSGLLTMATMCSLDEVTLMLQSGEMDLDQVQQCMELALDGCAQVHEIMVASLQESERKKKVDFDKQSALALLKQAEFSLDNQDNEKRES
eukprot:TRINITY_DN9683_c0_g1_i1.p3 TRINITY_DN9683_c0_g1~~TRINITY_DN9683_c0_g1_i1.p3  ORF type:complete len:115 (+),score=42.30 TRINITY_DN9683_c0_g1_i1:605-949(+)